VSTDGTGDLPPGAELAGQVVMVTGASSGLGAHFAQVLARHGAQVIAIARRVDRLDAVRATIEATGGSITTIAGDVADRASLRAAFAVALATKGSIDVLVNNAGTGILKPALEHTDEDWDTTFATNVRGAWELSRLFAEHRRGVGGGAIVNVASGAALVAIPNTAAYSASKAALVHLTKQLAREWAGTGLRVNCICPGHFETELNADFLGDPAFRARVARGVPLGRLGEYRELDGLLVLLASHASSYITGAVIPVDGGQSLRNP